jgi:hypothetical protein
MAAVASLLPLLVAPGTEGMRQEQTSASTQMGASPPRRFGRRQLNGSGFKLQDSTGESRRIFGSTTSLGVKVAQVPMVGTETKRSDGRRHRRQ